MADQKHTPKFAAKSSLAPTQSAAKSYLVSMQSLSAKTLSSKSKSAGSSENKSTSVSPKTAVQIPNLTELIPRTKYSKYTDFIFSCLGSVIGLGNICVFPALASVHGVGTYALIYIFFAIMVGLPILCLEMFIGQLSGLGIGKAFGLIAPLFQGLGYAIVALAFILNVQYSITVSFCFVYFLKSFAMELPWACCENLLSPTANCRSSPLCCSVNSTSSFCNSSIISPQLPSVEFYYNFVVQNENAKFSTLLFVSLVLTWCFIFGCLANGIRISSKVAYVTVVFPYFAILLLFIACLLDKKDYSQLKKIVTFDSSKFVTSQIWIDALTHVIYSQNVGSGVTTTLTSYNPFHNNCQRRRFKLYRLSGNRCSYDPGPLWSVLFFVVAVAVGLDSQIWITETIITEVSDIFHKFRLPTYRVLITAIVCVVSLALSSLACIKSFGFNYYNVLTRLLFQWCFCLFALLEVMFVVYVYGYKRFANDISLVLGSKPNWFWTITMCVTAPLTLFILLIVLLHTYRPLRVLGQHVSAWTSVVEFLLSGVVVSILLGFALYHMTKSRISKKSLSLLVSPTDSWCPRRKADLEKQKKELAAVEEGIMGDFELPLDATAHKERKARRL